jgi:lipoprotein NlpI
MRQPRATATTHGMKTLLPAAAFLALCASAFAAEPPMPAAERAALIAESELTLKTATEALAEKPDSVTLLSRRGDAHLFLGRFRESVADFEKMIALDPALDAPHWRLGIAYYFAGDFAKCARQFEKYHAHDGRDRENGIWKFLADTHLAGLEKARTQMLEYTRFDREPFPALYEMFAGKRTTDSVLEEVRKKELTGDGAVMFFAHYYCGLNELLLEHPDRARDLLARAVASPWGRTAEGGPAYMWQVARLHYERLAAGK